MHSISNISEAELVAQLKRRGVSLSRRALDGYVARGVLVVAEPGKKGSPRRFFPSAVETISGVRAESGGRTSLENAEVSAWIKSSTNVAIPRSAFTALAKRAMRTEILSELSSFAKTPAQLDDDERCGRALTIAQNVAEQLSPRVGVSSDLISQVLGDALVDDEPLSPVLGSIDSTEKIPGTDVDLVLDATVAVGFRGIFNLERFTEVVTAEQLLRGRRAVRAFEKALPFAKSAREKALGDKGLDSVGPNAKRQVVAFSRLVSEMSGVSSFEGVLQAAQFVTTDGDAVRIENGCRALEDYVKAPQRTARR